MNICIDIGGTNIKGAILSGGKLTASDSMPSVSEGNFSTTLSHVEEVIGRLTSQSGEENIDAVGVSIPGIVDVGNNRLLSVNEKLKGAENFDFNAWATGRFNAPLVMENDARAALTGEWQAGAGKGFNNLVMVTLGTGVGGAAMIGGKLLYGKHYQAGCLGGHFTINVEGDTCTCGNIGCVEAEASSWKLGQLILEHSDFESSGISPKADFKELFSKYRNGNTMAADIITHCLKAWSAGVVNMIHAYDPELVIISGGIMKSRDLILPYIQDRVDTYAWTPSERVRVVAAESTEKAALYGLNYLIEQKLLKKTNNQ